MTRLARSSLVFLAAILLMAGGKKPTFTFRIHAEVKNPTPGSKVLPVQLYQPSEQIYIGKYSDLNENQIQGFQKTANGGVIFYLTSVGKSALEALTSNNIGSTLVVICDGRVVHAPSIDMVIRDGRLYIPPGITDEELQMLTRFLKRKKRENPERIGQ